MARLTVAKIIEKVSIKMQDDSPGLDEDSILDALDQCNLDIATELDIKELATVSEINLPADLNSTDMPVDFCKNLVLAYNKTTSDPIKVYDSRRLMHRASPDAPTGGNVMAICADGTQLYYRQTPPTDQIAELYYHRNPDDLIKKGDFPLYIPGNYIQKLYFHYAVGQLYDLKEDGRQGEKVNTLYHNDKYSENLAKFKLFMGGDPDKPFMPDNDPNFDFNDYE